MYQENECISVFEFLFSLYYCWLLLESPADVTRIDLSQNLYFDFSSVKLSLGASIIYHRNRNELKFSCFLRFSHLVNILHYWYVMSYHQADLCWTLPWWVSDWISVYTSLWTGIPWCMSYSHSPTLVLLCWSSYVGNYLFQRSSVSRLKPFGVDIFLCFCCNVNVIQILFFVSYENWGQMWSSSGFRGVNYTSCQSL